MTSALVAAFLGTSIGSALFALAFTPVLRGSVAAGIALNLWLLLCAPGIFFMGLALPPGSSQMGFPFVMALAFVFNVMTWTGVLYGIGYFVAKFRARCKDASTNPA